MNNLIKYKPMLWVEVAFGIEPKEILYYEGSESSFKKSMQNDFIYFSIYNRNIARHKIKDFGIVNVENKKIEREAKMTSLTDEQKSKVKEYIKNMKRNIGREPSDKEFDFMVKKAIGFKESNNNSKLIDREKVKQTINKMRENKKLKGTYSLK